MGVIAGFLLCGRGTASGRAGWWDGSRAGWRLWCLSGVLASPGQWRHVSLVSGCCLWLSAAQIRARSPDVRRVCGGTGPTTCGSGDRYPSGGERPGLGGGQDVAGQGEAQPLAAVRPAAGFESSRSTRWWNGARSFRAERRPAATCGVVVRMTVRSSKADTSWVALPPSFGVSCGARDVSLEGRSSHWLQVEKIWRVR